jgi:glycine dehydrogenase
LHRSTSPLTEISQVSNASLLDEGTAAAEAMAMCRAVVGSKSGRSTLIIADACHPQTLSVIRTRAAPLGVDIVQCPSANISEALLSKAFAVFYSYPTTDGRAVDLTSSIAAAHAAGAKAIVATDPLALTLMKPPGEMGADIVVGSAQRFGVPMFFGGPHAGILAASTAFTRQMPGRIVGVTRDTQNRVALRLSLATRENHIRREKATSNICTAQALLANTAAAYAIFHGVEGIKNIALRINGFAKAYAAAAVSIGAQVNDFAFDTVCVTLKDKAQADAAVAYALTSGYNIRRVDAARVALSFDETVLPADVENLAASLAKACGVAAPRVDFSSVKPGVAASLARSSPHLKSPIFSSVNNEHEMVRYLEMLARKDISLVHSMMPLGSCTMKLNAQAEMLPLKMAAVQQVHPFAPSNQAQGYAMIVDDLKRWIGDITGLPQVSLQPNSGAAGEYAGLLVMREYHIATGSPHRNVCLIPRSAHGTNPASAAMANLKIIVIDSLENGDIDLAHLRKCVQENRGNLCGIMVTYPSTHGVYEETIRPLTTEIHEAGGLVYMDGANMNAQVGVMRPAEFGVDVLHLNLHKTFCIPHGGGGPGVGPIAVTEKLGPYLPSHDVIPVGGGQLGTPYAVSSAPWGSAGILPISWMYMKMMGGSGLRSSTIQAVMNANYMADRLREHYSICYTAANGRVAHEFILDLKPLKAKSGITEVDIAKRLMDYGFHAPTMSWPVPGSLMVEPTESESLGELDRFCDALIQIRHEIADVESGKLHKTNNPLRNAPHTQSDVVSDAWDRPYSREQAAFPLPWVLGRKVWPTVSRVDDTWGDKNFMCTCPTPDEMAAQSNQ